MISTRLDRLFEEGKIGSMKVKNRIVMSPMITDYADTDGYISQRQIAYYAERAKGGVGLIIVEASYVQKLLGRGFSNQIAVYDDKYLPGLIRLAEAIKKNGARAAIQLYHAGSAAHDILSGGLKPVGPSAVPYQGYEQSRALTREEIKEIIDCFTGAAIRCQNAGFDAVQIHACHHYLLANFLSPVWNRRSDEYGGEINNRARFLVDVLKNVKDALDIPVMCRINCEEYGVKEFLGVEQGTTLDDAKEIARLIETNGADAIHLTTWRYGPYLRYGHQPLHPGERLPLIEAIKKERAIPVIAFGRLTPEVAESALREGKADFIGIGRGLLADPYLPQKAAHGDLTDIAPCICCYHCGPISQWGYKSTGLTCAVNARCGHEAEYPFPISKARNSRKVIVVGGGPGGMEAARIAALRGHSVVLYEKSQELGGQLAVADKAPLKQYISLLGEYQKGQIAKASVKVALGTEASKDMILDQRADAVILATGSRPLIPFIKGLEKEKTVSAIDVLSGKVEAGEKVIIIGGNLIGCEVASFLADKGKRVTICELLPELLPQVIPHRRPPVTAGLIERGVVFHLGVTFEEVIENGMIILDKNGKEQLVEADTIVSAAGAEPNDELFHELKEKVSEVHCIGDAKAPRLIVDAVHEGFGIAYSL